MTLYQHEKFSWGQPWGAAGGGKGKGTRCSFPPAPSSGAAHDCNTMVDFVEPPTAIIGPRNRQMTNVRTRLQFYSLVVAVVELVKNKKKKFRTYSYDHCERAYHLSALVRPQVGRL